MKARDPSAWCEVEAGFLKAFQVPVPERLAEALRKKRLSGGDIFFSSRTVV
jgi:hypothetical protein